MDRIFLNVVFHNTLSSSFDPFCQKQSTWTPFGVSLHNFQLPVYNFNFRRNSFAVFIDLNRFWLSRLYVFMIANSYISYACSIV